MPKIFFEADFGGFAVILRIYSKLQKVIILGALRDSFEILGKSLTVFEILGKGYLAPSAAPEKSLTKRACGFEARGRGRDILEKKKI